MLIDFLTKNKLKLEKLKKEFEKKDFTKEFEKEELPKKFEKMLDKALADPYKNEFEKALDDEFKKEFLKVFNKCRNHEIDDDFKKELKMEKLKNLYLQKISMESLQKVNLSNLDLQKKNLFILNTLLNNALIQGDTKIIEQFKSNVLKVKESIDTFEVISLNDKNELHKLESEINNLKV